MILLVHPSTRTDEIKIVKILWAIEVDVCAPLDKL